MKKNLMSVLIFALVLVNLAFTAVMTFSILPATKNANQLIEDVAKAIKLELNAGKNTGVQNVSMADLETYSVNAGETINILLKKGSDGKDHYAVVSAYLSLNSKSEEFDTYKGTIDQKDQIIREAITRAVGARTKDEMSDQDVQAEVREEILEELQAVYNSDWIVDVGFASFLLQ
ncbi:flagellar FliL protein [Lachnospiraceae bacterium XBB1006]|nr:flagellar FliL protein [Lachnospiraceae bacterium XBB1006]